MLSADVVASMSNVTRESIDSLFIYQDLGGFGSELRADVRVGFLSQISTHYYRRLNSSGLFPEPYLGIIREPVYLWVDQKRIAERFEQLAGGGLDFGRTFDVAPERGSLTLSRLGVHFNIASDTTKGGRKPTSKALLANRLFRTLHLNRYPEIEIEELAGTQFL